MARHAIVSSGIVSDDIAEPDIPSVHSIQQSNSIACCSVASNGLRVLTNPLYNRPALQIVVTSLVEVVRLGISALKSTVQGAHRMRRKSGGMSTDNAGACEPRGAERVTDLVTDRTTDADGPADLVTEAEGLADRATDADGPADRTAEPYTDRITEAE
ncbi:MAG: hypothetical protein Q9159_004261 [Coniocarpon cinnabarinum]